MKKASQAIDWKEVKANCPVGYTVNDGEPINMLGAKELWRIFEHHAEPDLTRIPQDLVDAPFGHSAKRVPKEWGRCLYYRVI